MKTALSATLLLALTPTLSAQCLELGVQPPVIDVQSLGGALDVDGPMGIAGAPGSAIPFSDAGIAYLFDSSSGAILRALSPNAPSIKNGFGQSVAIAGPYAAVGAWLDDGAGNHAGAAYVFDTATGAQLYKLVSPFPSPGAVFGRPVVISGNYLLVGASSDPKVVPNGGAVYVFDLATGSYLHELVAPVMQDDLFGDGITADGNYAVASAPYSDLHGPDAGAAYLFDIPTGTLITELVAGGPPTTVFGIFGSASGGRVALSGTSSRVHMFDLATGTELPLISFPSTSPDNGLVQVALEGNLLLVGQSQASGFGKFAGRVLAFDLTTGQMTATFVDPSGEQGDLFGNTLALEGGRGYIGASGKSAIISNQGAVFFADLCVTLGTSYCGPAVANSSGASARIEGYGSTTVSDNNLVLRALDVPTDQFGLFLTSATQAFVNGPGGSQGNLCLGGSIGRFTDDIRSSGDLGQLYLEVDLGALPTVPPHAVLPGETWNFQAWFRDANPNLTSNFSDGLSITFL
jgi:FG-GAP repeat